MLELPRIATRKPVSVKNRRSLPEKERFCQGVQQAVANFGLSDIRKAVLSRVLDVELEERVPAERLFQRLLAQNPSGHHFLLPLADGSSFIGASPELLIHKQGDQIISNPLAGSAARQSTVSADEAVSQALLGSGKDSHEHKLVIDEIERLLSPLCEPLSVPAAPSLMSTRAMWHLSTLIEGQLKDSQTSALELATLLHPTPAVCGVPTRQAHKLINLIEPFDRELFAGTVGWCDEQGNGEWVVSIRCGRVYDDRIRLFAGCGIVADSDPESEWHETEAKLQTMLRVLLPEEGQ
nr:isochorismate synthase [Oceanobacter mangrovi]